MEVRNGGIERYYFTKGYMDIAQGQSSSYNYYAKDHLGNVRHVDRSASGTNNQIVNYYPFGGILNDGPSTLDVQNRLFSGKELDRMHGLNLYDYHARQYDGAGVRFTTMDPLCERYNGSQSAHVIDKYKLISNNCTTFVSDVLNNNGSNVLNVLHFLPTSSLGTYTSYEVKERFINPRSLLKHLYNQSHNPNSHVYKR